MILAFDQINNQDNAVRNFVRTVINAVTLRKFGYRITHRNFKVDYTIVC